MLIGSHSLCRMMVYSVLKVNQGVQFISAVLSLAHVELNSASSPLVPLQAESLAAAEAKRARQNIPLFQPVLSVSSATLRVVRYQILGFFFFFFFKLSSLLLHMRKTGSISHLKKILQCCPFINRVYRLILPIICLVRLLAHAVFEVSS